MESEEQKKNKISGAESSKNQDAEHEQKFRAYGNRSQVPGPGKKGKGN